ncbi:MAG: hypothetical protein AAGI66_04955 [Cyanobacteria bacterium P01_H01_bin.74]
MTALSPLWYCCHTKISKAALLSVCLKLFLLLWVSTTSIPKSFSDTLHLKDGTSMNGRLRHSNSDLIAFKTGGWFGNVRHVKRARLNSRTDIVYRRFEKPIKGEIIFSSPYSVEIKTPNAITQIDKYRIQTIKLGIAEGDG